MLKKPNKKYYRLANGEFMQVNGKSVKLPGYETFDFFLMSLTKNNYELREGKTGKQVGHGVSPADAIAQFHYYMAREKWSVTKLRREINRAVKRCGLSPRWKEDNG